MKQTTTTTTTTTNKKEKEKRRRYLPAICTQLISTCLCFAHLFSLCVSVYISRKYLKVIFCNQKQCLYEQRRANAYMGVFSPRVFYELFQASIIVCTYLQPSLASGAVLSLKLVLSFETEGPTMCKSSLKLSPFILINLCRYLGS